MTTNNLPNYQNSYHYCGFCPTALTRLSRLLVRQKDKSAHHQVGIYL